MHLRVRRHADEQLEFTPSSPQPQKDNQHIEFYKHIRNIFEFLKSFTFSFFG